VTTKSSAHRRKWRFHFDINSARTKIIQAFRQKGKMRTSVRFAQSRNAWKSVGKFESWHARRPAFKLKVHTSKTIWTIQWTSALELRPQNRARTTGLERAIFCLEPRAIHAGLPQKWSRQYDLRWRSQNWSSGDTQRATSVGSVHAKFLDGQQSVLRKTVFGKPVLGSRGLNTQSRKALLHSREAGQTRF